MPFMASATKKIYFYKLPSGKEPVRDFLKELSKNDRAKVGALLFELQIEHKLSMPHAKYLGKQLWELRVVCESGNARVFYFCSVHDYLVLLHAFMKKSNKTPAKELDLALDRKRYVELLEAHDEKK